MHNRKTIRLKEYDYSQNGAYYVTMCTQNERCMFGTIKNGKIVLNDAGRAVENNWQELPQRFLNIKLDEFIVMPNHLHGIIHIVGGNVIHGVGAGFPRPDIGILSRNAPENNPALIIDEGRGNRAPTLGQILAYYKYGTAKQINAIRNTAGARFWQRNYYEHIIRDEKDLDRIREYITNNPAQWEEDEYYSVQGLLCLN